MGCVKEENTLVDGQLVTQITPLWRTSLTSDQSELLSVSLYPPVVYNGNVLIGKLDENGPSFAMLNGKTGEIAWEWNDFFTRDLRKNLFIPSSYQFENLLTVSIGSNQYSIDLTDGTTIDRRDFDRNMAHLTGVGPRYFASASSDVSPTAYRGQIYTADLRDLSTEDTLIVPNYVNTSETAPEGGRIGLTGVPYPFIDESGDTMISYTYDNSIDIYTVNAFSGLYNYSKREHVYQDDPYEEGTYLNANGPFSIYNNQLKYHYARGGILCTYLYSNRVAWSREFSNLFFISGFEIFDDILVANNEDTYLYGLSPISGRQLWKTKASGTSSEMQYLNGVVYFVGGGDGLLHAVDIQTGKHLWKVRSPDLDRNSGAWFDRKVTVVPPGPGQEKGTVVVNSYIAAMAFEAAR